jgi:hypothetical protein
MGLDAYVYCNRARLPFATATRGVSIDDRTGVVDFDDPDLYRRFADTVVALHYRLGNIALIAQLAEEVKRTTAAELPITTNTVLGSGAHCGDLVELGQIDALEQELQVLADAAEDRSVLMDEFLSHMRELVMVARAELNPIYFG